MGRLELVEQPDGSAAQAMGGVGRAQSAGLELQRV